MFKKQYEIIYAYYFGETVFIPVLPSLFIYIPVFLFQSIYQIALIYELLFRKFITKKLNFLFIIPIVLITVTLTKSPYDNFKKYPLPNFKIQELMFRIQTNLEEYRVNKKYYPKTENRFKENVLSKVPKSSMLTDYTIKRKKVKTKIIFAFDKIGAYNKNINNYEAPTVVVHIGSSARKYWITAIIKDNYIEGKDTVLSYKKKAFILKDDVLIREKFRNKGSKDVIYHQLINNLKK